MKEYERKLDHVRREAAEKEVLGHLDAKMSGHVSETVSETEKAILHLKNAAAELERSGYSNILPAGQFKEFPEIATVVSRENGGPLGDHVVVSAAGCVSRTETQLPMTAADFIVPTMLDILISALEKFAEGHGCLDGE
jgi:hypothetical protein